MKHIRLFIASIALIIGMGGALAPAVALASAKSVVCGTLGSDSSCSRTPGGSVSVTHVVTTVVNILSFVVGFAAVIMVIIGGFRYITSGGDSNNVSSAKNTILYAIIGLVIAAMAQALVQFVLQKL